MSHLLWTAFRRAVLLTAILSVVSANLPAQFPRPGRPAPRPDFIPEDYDDYQNMLDQLGITSVRRGRDGRGPDTSDEATANRYGDSLPDLMTFNDGTPVDSPDKWLRRRAEIVEAFEREIYGRIPEQVPPVTWEVTETSEGESGGIATTTRTLAGRV